MVSNGCGVPLRRITVSQGDSIQVSKLCKSWDLLCDIVIAVYR